MPTLETHNGYALWHYIPNRPAAIVYVVIFILLTCLHGFLMFKHRLWFCIPFVIGGIFEVIGYIGRALAYNETGELIPYILQSVFLLLAPVFFAASLYMTLSRVVLAVDGAQYSMVPPRWLTRVFVTCDVISFFIQAGGAGILVQSDSASSSKTGQNVIVGGLVFQLIAFAAFGLTALVFNIRFQKSGLEHSYRDVPWQSILVMLYVTSALIIIRNIVRAAEYAMGDTGYLLTHEWVIYVLDGMLMIFTMVAFYWKYPSKLHKDAKKHDSNVELTTSVSDRNHRY